MHPAAGAGSRVFVRAGFKGFRASLAHVPPTRENPRVLWTVLFLVVVAGLLPLASVASARSRGTRPADPSALPSPNALAVQGLVIQAVVGGLAWAAARERGIVVAWESALEPRTLLTALGVFALFLGLAMFEARRPLDEHDVLRRTLRSAGLSLPWIAVALAAAFAEELAYRAVLTELLAGWSTPSLGALLSAAAFGVSHSTQGARAGLVGAAFALAMQGLVHLSGGLSIAVAVHLAYDLTAAWWGRRLEFAG